MKQNDSLASPSAEIIDFATAARRVRLHRRRDELRRLRAAQAARFGWTAAAAGPALPASDVVAR